MSALVVAGLYTHETNLRVEGFPLPYYPACFPFDGISASHAGVGLNVSVALARQGHEVRFASLIGQDETGAALRHALPGLGLDPRWLSDAESATSQSVILVAPDGTRQIHCDLKSLQSCAYPSAATPGLLDDAALAVVCNINFARPLLAEAHRRGIPIATDVHALSNFDDAYNHDFMAAADILFLSDEALPCSPEQAIEALRRRFAPAVIVVGLGAKGALLSERGQALLHVPAAAPQGVVNTVGAGDALFSAFIDQHLRGHAAPVALRNAVLYAGIKVAHNGATEGLMDREAFAQMLAARPV
ncbi:carbohydrate kinase family protein [Niveibacterium sp. SC-1]|uniref:carbohydrate kinase family protein n=1 Tax=Niveibacterium sp. SC-1 TaxID=3135646 RepID=UPI00311F31D8